MARKQVDAPVDECAARQGAVGDLHDNRIHCVNLDDVFCQIGTNSCNLARGTFPSQEVSD